MEFRVYDKKKKRWITDKVYLTPEGELFKLGKSMLGWSKPTYISENRYVYHNAIDLEDKNGCPIYMGDYLEAEVDESKVLRGLVTFAKELSAYIILCFDTDEYYTLGSDVSDRIRVIGNVFDEFFEDKKDEQDGQSTLQE